MKKSDAEYYEQERNEYVQKLEARIARVQVWIDANTLAGEYDTASVVTPGATTRRRCAWEVRAAMAGKE